MMDKAAVAGILDEMGTLLELKGANPFKSRAFHNAARSIEGLTQDLTSSVEDGSIRSVKGIGESIAKIVSELVMDGRAQEHDELRREFPDGLLQMLRIQGLGPKRVKVLYEKLDIKSVDQLEAAAREGRLRNLEGFGEKTEANILVGIQALRSHAEKSLFPIALSSAERMLSAVKKVKGVQRCEIAGSIRRRKEVIGDIDLLVSASDASRSTIMEAFTSDPFVHQVIAQGDTKSSVLLKNGMHCDLRIVQDSQYPFALNYFTGSKEHNVEMRSRARKKGLSLNEYDFTEITPLPKGSTRTRVARIKEEADIYHVLDLPYIPPELRENMGEFDFAKKSTLPRLLEEKDILGTFHCHTTYSDGVNTIEQLVDASRKRGWKYLGIADHSKAAAYAGGLSADRVKEQIREIDGWNERLEGFTLYKGTECDILSDGSLDWPEKVLAQFDYVVISVHSHFKMSEAEMTKRIIKALQCKYVTMLGHPTGRLLLSRDAYAVNMVQVIDAAADYGKGIEINAHPMRLDLDWRLCKYAKEKGVRISINPDAHTVEGLRDVSYGVGIARKGWLERGDVVNAWTPMRVTKYFQEVRG